MQDLTKPVIEMKKAVNPLANFMRQPKLYVQLPSKGKYWPEGSIIPTETGEYPVYSMTAKDELMLKTPDALLNGQAIVNVIQSCIPNITNAWHAPSIDIDALLIAIRLATYGEYMDSTIKVKDIEATYPVNLKDLLSELYGTINWDERLEINDNMVIYLRPLPYNIVSKASLETFETQRIMNLVNDNTIPEDQKIEMFKTSFEKLTNITIATIADSIYKIDTPAGSVTDSKFIQEFIENCDKPIFNAVKDKLDDLRKTNSIKPMRVRASDEMIAAGSEEEIEVPIVFDASTFFV